MTIPDLQHHQPTTNTPITTSLANNIDKLDEDIKINGGIDDKPDLVINNKKQCRSASQNTLEQRSN